MVKEYSHQPHSELNVQNHDNVTLHNKNGSLVQLILSEHRKGYHLGQLPFAE